MLAYHDGAAGQHRYAAFRDGCLSGALFVAPQPVAAARNWLIGRIGQKVADPRDRLRLLAGRAGEAGADHGAIVFRCFEVGVNQIATAIAQGCHRVEAVRAVLQAGTNRSDERRVGKEWVSTCRSWWSP